MFRSFVFLCVYVQGFQSVWRWRGGEEGGGVFFVLTRIERRRVRFLIRRCVTRFVN